jgi:hypothetical protein
VHVHQENHGKVGMGVLNPWQYPAATGCFLSLVLHEVTLLQWAKAAPRLRPRSLNKRPHREQGRATSETSLFSLPLKRTYLAGRCLSVRKYDLAQLLLFKTWS